MRNSCSWNFNLARVNAIDNVVCRLSVNGATDALRRTEDFLDSSRELFCKGFRLHCSGDFNNLIKGNVSSVFNIFLLLSVTRRLYSQN